MAEAPEPALDDHLWTIAVARLIFGPTMNIQAPPNLTPTRSAGWSRPGSTTGAAYRRSRPDHVNPEAPWPASISWRAHRRRRQALVERLAIYPEYALEPERWLDPALRTPALGDRGGGFCPARRVDRRLGSEPLSARLAALRPSPGSYPKVWERGDPAKVRGGEGTAVDLGHSRPRGAGEALSEHEIVSLFQARGDALARSARPRTGCAGGSMARRLAMSSPATSTTPTSAISAASSARSPRASSARTCAGVPTTSISPRSGGGEEAWERGATEVCLQGGIHPEYTGATYLEVCRAIKAVVPDMHVHAFSPLEIWQGAKTLGRTRRRFFSRTEGRPG